MRRSPKPAKDKVDAKLTGIRKSAKDDDARVRDLERRLAEALEQQASTAEILRVISSSPTELQPVLDAVAEAAARLCSAYDAVIFRRDGDVLRVTAHYGPISVTTRTIPIQGTVSGRAVLSRQPIHVADLQAETREFPEGVTLAQEYGFHTLLSVPLLREGAAIGTINLRRTEVRPFLDSQIALLQTFADQAVIAIENVRLFSETQEALEQQTATSEILRIISSSPTDLQPVLDAVAERAARLCNADDVKIHLVDGDTLRLAAQRGPIPSVEARPIIPTRHIGRAVLERKTIHVHDMRTALDQFPDAAADVLTFGPRTSLATPLLREGVAIGVIQIRRLEVKPFSATQIALLETFADQAVIAIENVRLFNELGARNRDLTEALEQPTATAEILRVISQSQTDVQPVFDTIARNSVRLCSAAFSYVFRFDGQLMHVVAHHNVSDEGLAALARQWPMSPNRRSIPARAVLDGSVVHVHDALSEQDYPYQPTARALGLRTLMAVPMLRDGHPVGAIAVCRQKVEPFSDRQIDLVKTFADQAVIAIENVRLFNETKEALAQQTATSEILRVVSSSPTDVQPVFEAIASRVVRLCDAFFSTVWRYDGTLIHHAADSYPSEEMRAILTKGYPAPAQPGRVMGQAISESRIIHVEDLLDDSAPPASRDVAIALGYRTLLCVPMLRDGVSIGAISVARQEVRPFSDRQIELVQTFADQAVIAIENVRLFKEVQARTAELTRSVEQLTALGEVSRAVSSTLDIEAVLDTIVTRASQLARGAGCSIYEYDEDAERFELRATHRYDAEFVEALRASPLRKGEGLMGRAAEMHEPAQIPDITQPGAYRSSLRDTLIRFGYRALLSVPLLREDQIIGSLSFNRKTPGEFSREVVEVLKTFATQSALAIQNARLFREIEDKSRQLEVASQHKSEFLANMSHELRTPLNAIIGFSEVLTDRMFGDLNEKQEEYLKDIYASGTHLLSLINDILDLSKIEAGRMELELTEFDLPTAIENALMLVRERAGRRSITLHTAVDRQLGQIQADERKIRQVVLNLLSNAIKFTPEGGRIEVGALPKDGFVEVSVSDTGIGIAPEDQEKVFEEFRQVGTAAKKVEGTGLGLTLCRKFVELHGGRIWVKSEVGAGSTFTFTLPRTVGLLGEDGI